MDSLKIAHFSNLYLYYNFEKLSIPPEVGKKMKDITKARFIETIRNLVDKGVDALVFSGNTLYGDDVLPKDLNEFNDILKHFNNKVFIVPGETDPYSLYSKFHFDENIIVFSDDKIDKFSLNNDIHFYGIGGKLNSLELIKSIPTSQTSINVFCAFLPDSKACEDNPIDNFQYMAFGGNPAFVDRYEKNFCYYPGSFTSYDWNIGEGSYLLSYISKSNNSISKVSSNTLKVSSITINFSKKIDVKQHLSSILLSNDYRSSVLKVYLEGKNFEFINFDELKRELNKEFLYLEIINNLIPDKRSLKKIESSFYDMVDDRKLIYQGIEFLRGKGDY